MKERFVLLNSPMVQAVIEGTKTVTRRPLNPQPELFIQAGKHSTYKYRGGLYALELYTENSNILDKCPFGKIGDRLWIRETWAPVNLYGEIAIAYKADGEVIRVVENKSFQDEEGLINYEDPRLKNYSFSAWADDLLSGVEGNWKPSIHMPRWASRLLLEITNIKIERIQDISESDSLNEGIERVKVNCSRDGIKTSYKDYEVDGITRNNPIDSFRTLWKKTYGAESWDLNSWVWVIEFKVIEGDDK